MRSGTHTATVYKASSGVQPVLVRRSTRQAALASQPAQQLSLPVRRQKAINISSHSRHSCKPHSAMLLHSVTERRYIRKGLARTTTWPRDEVTTGQNDCRHAADSERRRTFCKRLVSARGPGIEAGLVSCFPASCLGTHRDCLGLRPCSSRPPTSRRPALDDDADQRWMSIRRCGC